MKVTKFNRLSELIANNTLVYVLGEHGTVVVGFGGSLGIVLCSEELARQIHVLGGTEGGQLKSTELVDFLTRPEDMMIH